MVRAIRAEPIGPVKRIYDEFVEHDRNIEVEIIPQFNSIRSILARNRALLMPAHPESVENVIIPDEYMFSWDNERFLRHQDNDWGILIYGTEENFLNLSRCRTIFIDGTFKTNPHPYYQFLTIHGNYHGFVVPFVMCLLGGKQIGKYRQVLQHVKDKIFQLSEEWQ